MVQQFILAKQRGLILAHLNRTGTRTVGDDEVTVSERMQNTIVIRPNPLNDPLSMESVRDEEEMRDGANIRNAATLYEYMERGGSPIKCNVSRNSRAHIESGSMPPDEDVDMWDVVIPGGLPITVRASHLAIVYPQDTLDPNRVYTITNINQDYLKVIARLTMQLYGVRRS